MRDVLVYPSVNVVLDTYMLPLEGRKKVLYRGYNVLVRVYKITTV